MNFEKLGAFYLGKTFDLERGKTSEELLLYDSKDLVTHGACFGMTGSGKTGLCVVLLEEAAIDGIPAIVIDPKGDLSNLLLTFPDLKPEDFAPWVPEGAARQKGVSPVEYAAAQAELWKNGLKDWGEDGARIARLRAAADFAVYTPGSEAGIPVSLLRSFEVPGPNVRDDRELFRERVQGTVTSLLGLLGLDADPVQSREHILLSLIFDKVWADGRDLDLPALIRAIQNPPVEKVGMFDLESFYPAKQRFNLAMTMNNVLASPGFEAWLAGEPLDLNHMLYTAEGRPRISIFSIAHLNDAERMFFVSMLLNQTVGWMRQQSGTASLRALLYMDEIAGYLPPVANPPSKPPLMTLLKQARAFGVGVVLATQNPMDLDYKALGNMGTWFVGRLQTDRDQARVLDGLAGAAAGAGMEFDRQAMEATLAGLGKRVFLMYNVHEEEPVVFHTRWALSYLPGPLTRNQLKRLKRPHEETVAGETELAAPDLTVKRERRLRPVLPPEVRQYFVPVGTRCPEASWLVYEPVLVGFAEVGFVNARANCNHSEDLAFWTPLQPGAVPADWELAEALELEASNLEAEAAQDADYLDLPKAAAKAQSYRTWSRKFAQWLYTDQELTLLKSPSLKIVSQPGEEERDFRIRLELAAREERDRQVDKLRKRYETKFGRLRERIRKAEATVHREQSQASQQKLQSAISIGGSLLGALFGRKIASGANVSRAGTAFRSVGRASKESQDVDRARENLEACRRQLADLELEFEQETGALEDRIDPRTEEFETVIVKPRKSDITVQLVSLAWLPFWHDEHRKRSAAW